MRRILCVLLVLGMVFALLPPETLALTADKRTVTNTGRRVIDSRQVTGISSNLSLKAGHYERWIDRLDNLPSYARSFYNWLGANSGAQGALANPAVATYNGSDYYYNVTVCSQTEKKPATASNYKTVAAQLVEQRAAAAFKEVSDYLGVVYDAFDRDHPEVFWLNGRGMYGYGYSYRYSYQDGTVTVSYDVPIYFYLKSGNFDIRYDSYCTTDAIAKGIALRDQAVKNILAQCPTSGTADQVRYLNKVLTEQNAYNSAVVMGNSFAADDLAWECLSALVGSVGLDGPVCEGYSRAFMVLCQKLGIPCVLVDGAAKSTLTEPTEDHMWNYVKLDGSWYAVDVTWNDPYSNRDPLAKLSGFENEKWLLLGSDTQVATNLTFIQSHPEENRVSGDGLMFTNGPLLSKSLYKAGQSTAKLRVTTKNPGDSRTAIQLSLYAPGSQIPFAVKSLTGSNVDYTFSNLTAGSYLLVLSKAGYASMDCTVSTEVGYNQLPTLTLLGDITLDGNVNVGDVAKIYAAARGLCTIADTYHLRIADLNGDGMVTIVDVARVYALVKQSKDRVGG